MNAHGNNVSPFSFSDNLDPLEWQALENIAHVHDINKGDYIFRANELNNSIYILLEGRVKITRLSKHGRELIQWFCIPGEIFGLAQENNGQRGLYAYALSQVKLLSIQTHHFNQYLLRMPRVSVLIVQQLVSRLRIVGDLLLNITSEDAHVRFVTLLKRLSEKHGRNKEEGIYIDIYLTHQEMADMIGVCRQTISSMISKLKRRGIISSDRKGLYIKSPNMLEEYGKRANV